MDELWKEVDVRVIDQRLGVGVGGMDTIIRLLHKPTGIIIEMPRLHRKGPYYDRQTAMEMLAHGLSELEGEN
jgi:protein subunit release factor A